jgi:transcriptional regulator
VPRRAFHGAGAYISPCWYASKALHGKVVPTWNYAVVHAHGIPEVLADLVDQALRSD